MSYKFTLDHTLAIENIHDMITIDIKPDTRCGITGRDVEIHGYLTFSGSYLTDELGEERFEGAIPLDITLPYLGGAPDIQPEIASFDYRVTGGESLTLNLEVLLNGYEAKASAGDARPDVMDAWIEPVVPEPVIEEAVIEPFNISPPVNESADTLASVEKEDALVDRVGFMAEEEPVDEEQIPYSPLVEIEERMVEIEEIEFSTPRSEELPIEMVNEESESVQEEVIIPVVEEEGRAPKMTNTAAALMNELFAMKRGTAFKEQEEVPMEEEGVREEAIDVEAIEEAEVAEPPVIFDSVARQFSDGASTIKMVYVRHESETLGGVLERHSVTMDDVWNLPELTDGVGVGDCIMIKYEKPI